MKLNYRNFKSSGAMPEDLMPPPDNKDPTAMFLPGRDYPDREIWLSRRYTPHTLQHGLFAEIIYTGQKPLLIGVNRMKRRLDLTPAGRAQLIKARHAYYRRNDNRQEEAQ